MSWFIVAVGFYIASAVGFIRYGLGVFHENRGATRDSGGEAGSLISLKKFHYRAGLVTLALGIIATAIAIIVQLPWPD